jgi:TonB family protein
MRSIWMILLQSTLIASAVGQSAPASAPTPELPKDPQAIFAAARPLYDFSAPTVKPWHMKVSYQLYDENGKPSDPGTYEYWWASPNTYRSSWTRSGLSQTDWHVNGQHSHAVSGTSLTFFERKLQAEFLNPLPKPESLDPKKVRFDKQDQKFGSVKLPCVMLVPKMQFHGQIEQAPLGEFPTYCFSPDHPVLRAFYAFGATSVLYNRVVMAQGVYLPKEIRIQDGSRLVLTASVDALEKIPASSPDLVPAKDAEVVSNTPRVEITSGVAQGQLLKQVRPYYPQEAKTNHDEGKVVLQAVIGTDGRVHDLSVVEGPSPLLIGSAMWAVSQWEYKPYLLNGSPVEVDTTVNVFFKMSQ